MTTFKVVTPSSVTHTGTSASIRSDGGVEFSSVTVLSVNDVFSATYRNYRIYMRSNVASGNPGIQLRLRSGGSDRTGSDYIRQNFTVQDASSGGGRATGDFILVGATSATLRSGTTIDVYSPFVTGKTSAAGRGVWGIGNASHYAASTLHTLSQSHDGFTLFNDTYSGVLYVFGYGES